MEHIRQCVFECMEHMDAEHLSYRIDEVSPIEGYDKVYVVKIWNNKKDNSMLEFEILHGGTSIGYNACVVENNRFNRHFETGLLDILVEMLNLIN
jgi:hypothetical protein